MVGKYRPKEQPLEASAGAPSAKIRRGEQSQGSVSLKKIHFFYRVESSSLDIRYVPCLIVTCYAMLG